MIFLAQHNTDNKPRNSCYSFNKVFKDRPRKVLDRIALQLLRVIKGNWFIDFYNT